MSAKIRRSRPLAVAASGPATTSPRAVIDQATGVLVMLYRVDADQAFWTLYSWARETGSSVLTVARTLIYAICLEDDSRIWDRDVRDYLEAALAEVRPMRIPSGGHPRRATRLESVE